MLEMFKPLKNRKEMPYFQTKHFCHGAQLDVTCGGELGYLECSAFKIKETIDLKTCQDIYC